MIFFSFPYLKWNQIKHYSIHLIIYYDNFKGKLGLGLKYSQFLPIFFTLLIHVQTIIVKT